MKKESKISVNLQGVPQTLLLPLLARAMYSETKNPAFYDRLAIHLIHSIDYDFDSLLIRIKKSSLIWGIARTYQFDKIILQYIYDHPDGTIVNLGAGLDTTFYRIDNGRIKWIDLDLPEVMAIRDKLLPPDLRIKSLHSSIFDFSWIDELKKSDQQFLFVVGGVFAYFRESEVKTILINMNQQFPNSELVMDVISNKIINRANKFLEKTNMTNAKFQWGVTDVKILTEWAKGIKILKHISFFHEIKIKYSFPIAQRFKMFLYDLLDRGGGIVHVKFNINEQ